MARFFDSLQTVQRTVLWPEPYRTFSETWHYVPEPGDNLGQYRVPDLPDNGIPGEEPPFMPTTVLN